LRIPEGKTEQFYTEVAKIAEDQKRSWVRHRVRRGETLSTIAQKYGVTMNAIKDLKENRIGYKNRIHTGQYLLVPVPAHKYIPGSGEVEVEVRTVIPVSEGKEKIIYIVRSGDNLSTIAEKYHTSVNAIRRWNNLESRNLIRAGQKLVIWSDEVVEIPVTSSAIPNSAVTKQTHIVRSGETLGSIAQKYGLSLESLKKINDLNDPGLIHPGDIIKLYNDSDSALVTEISGELLYTVKQGDTLWEIAETYKISLSALKRHNNFRDGSVIKPGDKIKIPVRQ
jgi:membrane-bound lytic murein transglycosylase D